MNSNPYDDRGMSLREQEKKVSKLIDEISTYQHNSNDDHKLPPHLEQFKRDMEVMELSNVQLPIRSTLSPKMKMRLASLPTPTDDEIKKAINYTKEVQYVSGMSAYKDLINSADKSRAKKHRLNENDISHIDHIVNSSSKRSMPSDVDVDDSSTEYYRKMERIKKRKAEIQAKVEAANSPTPSSRGNTEGVRPLSPFGSGIGAILGSMKTPSSKTIQLPKLSSTPQQHSNLDAYLSSIKKQVIVDTDKDISPMRNRGSVVSSSLSLAPSSSQSSVISVSKSMTSLRQSNSAASDRNDNNIKIDPEEADNDSISTRSGSMVSQSSTKLSTNFDQLPHDSDATSRSMKAQILSPINRRPPPLKSAPEPIAAAFEAVNSSMKQQQRNFAINESMKDASSKNNKKFLDSLKSNLYDQLGLDVDKNFTKRRLYSKGFRTLVYFTYNFKIKEAFTWYSAQVKREIIRRRTWASLILTRVGRGMNARTRVRNIRTAIRLRKEAEALKRKKAREAIIIGSHVITRFIRRAGKRLRDSKDSFTMQSRIDIQKITRGFIARRRCKHLAEIRRIRNKAATIIQCCYRQRLARRRVVLFQKVRSVHIWLCDLQAEKQAIREELQREGAATCMSRYYRAYRIRIKLAQLIFWHRWEVAISFQKLFRGHSQRKAFKKLLRLKREKERKRRVASTNIQRVFRGFVSRKYITNPLKEAKAEKRRQALARKLEILDRDKKEETWQDWWEKNHPSRHIKVWNNAIRIQKIYRGYKGRKRSFVIMINTRIKAIVTLEKKKNYGATQLQKILRGYLYRIKRFRAYRLKMVFVIQCAWRCYVARKTLRKNKREYDATTMISKNIAAFYRLRQYNKLREERRKFNTYARTIQRLFRCWQGRNLWNYRKYEIRAERESRNAAAFQIESFMACIQLKMLLESLSTPMGNDVPSQTTKSICPCKGPIQALFVSILGVKGRYEDKALITNKIDAISFQKFIYKIKGVMLNAPKQKKDKGRKPKLLILRYLLAGGFSIPTGVNSLSPTDLDLLFNKTKAETESDGLLDFDGFLKLMTYVAEIHFKPKEGGRKRGQKENENKGERKFAVLMTDSEAAEATRSRNTNRLNLVADKKIVSGDEPECNLLLAFIIKCLTSLQDERFYDQITTWMNHEVEARLFEYARLMGVAYRRRKAKLWRQFLAERRRMKYIQDNLFNTVACIQKFIRRFICIHRQAHVAQKFLIKYIPHTGQPYWYNPSTRVASEKKPKILRNYDSVSIALPPEGLANIIKCCNCPSPSQVNCNQCEDSFCKRCFDNVHCKGQRRNHNYVSIPYCSNCKYQVGCKNCLTCILNKPVAGSLQAAMKESERGTLCDTCFTHFHDPIEISLADPKFANRKKAERTMMMQTKEAYLVGQQIHQGVITDHRFDNLIEPCEECQWRSATWRCDDCRQIYCHSCLTGLHSIGGPFSKHRAELLPYYTPEMHANYMLSYKEQRMHERMNIVIRAAQEAREQFKSQSIVRVQTWWRRIYYAREGHRIMHIARLKIRKAHRERKKDEPTRANTKYKMLDIFGKAPTLRSDTKEEKVLKRLPAWWRQRAREYIWRNQSDWGFYKVSRTEPQKGTPKQGFSVGTFDELLDQAQKGGYRLPGNVLMKKKESTHTTMTDLSNLVKPGVMIRVANVIYCTRAVTENTITFDRRWHKTNSEELIFRMPTFNDEKYCQYYKLKYKLTSGIINNFAGQLYFKAYYSYHKGILKLAIKQMKECKKKKQIKMMNEWKATALNSQQAANWALCYIADDMGDADLSEQQENKDENPDDAESQAAKAIRKATKGLDADADISKSDLAELLSNAPDDATKLAIAQKMRKPGQRYYPIQVEVDIRKRLEDEMTLDELIATADDWLIEQDIQTGNTIYIHKETLAMSNDEPKALTLKKKRDAEEAATKASYEEAKKRMEAVQKNLTKGKKKF